MSAKLFKGADVCERAQLQPYVLRLWEKEFPGIGLQKGDGPRFYRESDLEQVLHIKQLVFGEGLTLAGVRRRLEGDVPVAPVAAPVDEEPVEVLDREVKQRIGQVREGLRSILAMLDARPAPFALAGASVPVLERAGAKRGTAARSKKAVAPARRAASTTKSKRASA